MERRRQDHNTPTEIWFALSSISLLGLWANSVRVDPTVGFSESSILLPEQNGGEVETMISGDGLQDAKNIPSEFLIRDNLVLWALFPAFGGGLSRPTPRPGKSALGTRLNTGLIEQKLGSG